MTFAKKLGDLTQFGLSIVVIGFEPKAHLFELAGFLIFLRITLLLLQIVPVFTKIGDLAERGIKVGIDLNQI